jgi:hypothetical protein
MFGYHLLVSWFVSASSEQMAISACLAALWARSSWRRRIIINSARLLRRRAARATLSHDYRNGNHLQSRGTGWRWGAQPRRGRVPLNILSSTA